MPKHSYCTGILQFGESLKKSLFSANGASSQTLELMTMSRLFYHCAKPTVRMPLPLASQSMPYSV
jgi:hypothetical protein